jgi:hypothetical protein
VEENIDEIEFDESMSENRRARLAYATRNLSTSSGKRYISGSKQIATTAKFILNHLALGSFHQLPKGEDFSYIHTALTTEDLAFYNARNTDMKVIELCVRAYENAPPWDLLPLPEWSTEDLAILRQREVLAQEVENNTYAMCQKVLVKKGYEWKENIDILTHDKLHKTVMTEIMKLKARERPLFNECAVLDCKNRSKKIVCRTCKPTKPFCSKLHAEHKNHKHQMMKDKFKDGKLNLIFFIYFFIQFFYYFKIYLFNYFFTLL